MDVFSRTFLPAAAEAGIPIPAVSRHMPVLRRCVEPEETTLLVARGNRPAPGPAGSYLLLLTDRHLIVSREGRLLRRVALHLAAPIRELSEVNWAVDGHTRTMEFATTVSDGVRERFWIPVPDRRRAARVDALLGHTFGLLTTPAG